MILFQKQAPIHPLLSYVSVAPTLTEDTHFSSVPRQSSSLSLPPVESILFTAADF